MSKMIKPEMSVVHFKEADVIVTSGVPTTMSASGWADGTPGNLKVTYGDTDYEYANRSALTTALTNNGQTANVHTTSGKDYTISQIFGAEHNGTDDTFGSLGGFTWDSANRRWNSYQ